MFIGNTRYFRTKTDNVKVACILSCQNVWKCFFCVNSSSIIIIRATDLRSTRLVSMTWLLNVWGGVGQPHLVCELRSNDTNLVVTAETEEKKSYYKTQERNNILAKLSIWVQTSSDRVSSFSNDESPPSVLSDWAKSSPLQIRFAY